MIIVMGDRVAPDTQKSSSCFPHSNKRGKHNERCVVKKKRKRCCRVSDCFNKNVVQVTGYCKKHHKQYRYHGRVPERTNRDKNEIIKVNGHSEIILYNRKQQIVGKTKVSNTDLLVLEKYKWCLGQGYAVTRIGKKVLRLHRVLFPDEKLMDHKNRNKLDNRRCNLRKCTHSQNCYNRGKQINNTSNVTGIYWNTSLKKWEAKIGYKKQLFYLGTFKEKQDAIKKRKEYERKLFKDFAVQ